MSKPDRFDLEKAIAAWRRTYQHRRLFTPDDLKELECHLRDEIDVLRVAGRPDKQAFYEATRARPSRSTGRCSGRRRVVVVISGGN